MGLSPELREWVHKSVGEYKSREKAATMQEHLERSAGLVQVAAGNRPVDDDTFQGCMAHLCYAATKFDPNRWVEWSTFAVNCAKRWFIKEWRAEQVRVKTVNGVKSKIDGEIADATDFIPDESIDVDRTIELRDTIREMMRQIGKLSDREQEVLYLHWGLGGGAPWTFMDIAKRQGCSKEYIRQIEMRAIQKLQQRMEEVC